MTLFQPVYEYDKDVFGRKLNMVFHSTIVYDTMERAKLCAFDTWKDLQSDNDTLKNITIQQLILG